MPYHMQRAFAMTSVSSVRAYARESPARTRCDAVAAVVITDAAAAAAATAAGLSTIARSQHEITARDVRSCAPARSAHFPGNCQQRAQSSYTYTETETTQTKSPPLAKTTHPTVAFSYMVFLSTDSARSHSLFLSCSASLLSAQNI